MVSESLPVVNNKKIELDATMFFIGPFGWLGYSLTN
jgi:hypothetical protein